MTDDKIQRYTAMNDVSYIFLPFLAFYLRKDVLKLALQDSEVITAKNPNFSDVTLNASATTLFFFAP